MRLRTPTAALATACLLAVSACGGDSDDGASAGAEKLTADTSKATGNVTFCVAEDTTGSIGESIKQFNAKGGVKVKLQEMPEAADETRAQQIQRLRAKDPQCDVLGMDVIWVAEYAAQGWLRDVTDVVEPIKSEFIPSTVESARYEGKYWAIPYVTDTGFLYYRTDKLDGAPATWQEAYAKAADTGGLVYQGMRYEGLTVHFLELLFSAGGTVLDESGEKTTIDSPQTREVLTLLQSGIKDGAVPKSVVTYAEEEARRAFEAGKASIMRNWPYAYALGRKSDIKDDFDVAPLPKWNEHPGSGILGGYDLGISAFSKNPQGALAFAQYMAGEEAQRIAGERTFPPVRLATYDDPAVRKALPFADTLREAATQAKPRPVSPVYAQISQAIADHVSKVLKGTETPDQAATGMAKDIDGALSTF